MDLWRSQYSFGNFLFKLGTNPAQPIRPPSMKQFLNQKQRERASVENETLFDRGVGTVSDTVSFCLIKLGSPNRFSKYYKIFHVLGFKDLDSKKYESQNTPDRQ